MSTQKITFLKEMCLKAFSLLLASIIWLPMLHCFFKPAPESLISHKKLAPMAKMLAKRHLKLWTDPQMRKKELDKMQQSNPEWDFMSRTYFVLALANIALHNESFKDKALEIMDLIIDNTLKLEAEKGPEHFLLDYAKDAPWIIRPARSQFLDGEIAIMLAARRFLQEKEAYKKLLLERTELMLDRMNKSSVLCSESYPDECWTFCNSVSIAAICMCEILDKKDYSAFIKNWLTTAKNKLVDKKTGILISAFAVDGTPTPAGFGPEGTTIWMVCNMLQIVDKEFAQNQYLLAKKELGRAFLGFGFSREWPESCMGTPDVDSGPIIPYFDASAAASGLAILAASAFNDKEYLMQLITSLNFAGFPAQKNGELRYQASNPVGDAVLLYAMVSGPLWDEVERRAKP
ncbi:hypothetical protein ACFL35_12585 [Candidatus Riflebacteria bacterium]